MTNRILLVDDEPDIVVTLKKRLECNGYEVLTADRGNEAIDIARRMRPDLIILDIMMPGMDGTQVSQALRQERMTKQIPIIFLTALQTKEGERMSGNFIANEIIFAKPYDPKQLLHQIESVLDKKIL